MHSVHWRHHESRLDCALLYGFNALQFLEFRQPMQRCFQRALQCSPLFHGCLVAQFERILL
jgi:hypothetical protein